MKLVLDMNLSPTWVDFLIGHGFEAVHWSDTGDPRAKDAVIMEWARANSAVVFTHDLDFSALLAATVQNGPSVLQVRSRDVMPSAIGQDVIQVLRQYEEQLMSGALITIDEIGSRVRILPIRK